MALCFIAGEQREGSCSATFHLFMEHIYAYQKCRENAIVGAFLDNGVEFSNSAQSRNDTLAKQFRFSNWVVSARGSE